MFAMLAVFGARGRAFGVDERRGSACDPEIARRAARAVSRLSLLADLPTPAMVVVPRDAPLSWTTALPGRQPRVHVTTGLLDELNDRELEAVIAHELSHLGNHDAVLMTILAAPGVSVLRGLEVAQNRPDRGPAATAGLPIFWLVFGLPAAVSGFFARIVSRHREWRPIAAPRCSQARPRRSRPRSGGCQKVFMRSPSATFGSSLRATCSTSCRRGRNARSTL